MKAAGGALLGGPELVASGTLQRCSGKGGGLGFDERRCLAELAEGLQLFRPGGPSVHTRPVAPWRIQAPGSLAAT